MNFTKFINIFASFLLIGLISVSHAHAATTPSFPVCTNPQGTLKVEYQDGIHGIVGNAGEFQGRDSVYSVSGNDIVLQCFCPTTGSGIQTNWLKADSYSSDDIKVLVNDGWILVQDGSAWGLDQGQYLAKNSNFSCSGGQAQGSSNSNTSSQSTTDRVLGAASEKLSSLASTGNLSTIYSFLAAGISGLILGIILRKQDK